MSAGRRILVRHQAAAQRQGVRRMAVPGSLWDGGRWCIWIPGPNGMIELHPTQAYHADYVAHSAAGPNDIVIPFVDLMWQRASWPEICPLISAISADFHNFGTSVEKLTYFFEHRNEVPAVTAFVKTELEYLFTLSRSVFDLLHEAISLIWNSRIRLIDRN